MPHSELEHTLCPLCSASGFSVTRFTFPPHAIVRCLDCGLLYLRPRLTEAAMLAGYSEGSYFEGEGLGYESYAAQEATLRATFRRLLTDMERLGVTGGKLLEIGCAYGFFLDEARSFFDHRTGTDYSATALDRAEGRAEELVHGGVRDLPKDVLYDCAVCIHVIEHVYRPVRFTRRIFDRLRPGGALLLAAPDAGSFWLSLLGRRWPFFKIPEHVSHFDQQTLRSLMERAGGEEVRTIPYVSYFHSGLVARKLGIPLPPVLRRLPIRMPGTTVALLGKRSGGSAYNHPGGTDR